MIGDALRGRRGLVLGVANDRSIAWGITKSLHRAGARLGFTYQGERLERRVRPLVEEVDGDFLVQCDVTSSGEVSALFETVREKWDGLDFLVHCIAFANKEDLEGKFIDTSREGFLLAHDVSAYSLTHLCREAAPLMSDGGSIVTLSYLGGTRAVPGYNVMGVAKASLESSVRYLAHDLGGRGIRVNAISAGPINTLSARGIAGFGEIFSEVEKRAPLKRGVTIEEVGNAAAFLVSPLASGITGEILFVDGGYNVTG
ncbi:MAG TPA: enoyl-ACP reductase [Planctomycetes bacterium]|nr:enoyl-ACP reductase [Planctomycetota bacterium]